MFQDKAGQESGPKPSGYKFPLCLFKLCCLGGGSLDGGDLVSPRRLGPSRSTPGGCGAAHGPRHPANLLLLGTKCFGLCFGFCLYRDVWVRLWLFARNQKFFVDSGCPLSHGPKQCSYLFYLCLLLGFPRGVRLALSQRRFRTTRPTG